MVSVSMRSGKTPLGNLLITSCIPDHSRTRFVISHKSRRCDAWFVRQFLELKWTSQLIMNDSKIVSMVVENLNFLGWLNYLPMILKSIPKSFVLTCKKGTMPTSTRPTTWIMWALTVNPSTGTSCMSSDNRTQFSAGYEE